VALRRARREAAAGRAHRRARNGGLRSRPVRGRASAFAPLSVPPRDGAAKRWGRIERRALRGSCPGGDARMSALRHFILLLAAALAVTAAPACAQGDAAAQRRAMVEDIERMVRATSRSIGKSRLDDAVMRAMAEVPRHEFVPPEYRVLAYANRPLPIGEGQTISQPYIVALRTELAAVDAASVVLEIGTGSGYRAAVLAEIAAEVYTIEIVEPLGRRAAATLERLGYDNVSVRIGDGYVGW